MKSSTTSRRRHSFMPTSPPGPPATGGEDPMSPATINPVVHSPVIDTRASVASLDGGPRPPKNKEEDLLGVPETQSRAGGRKRLSSLLTFRNKSDSHLSDTARRHAQEAPPALPSQMPAIMKTAPTQDDMGASKRRSTFLLPRRPKTPKRNVKAYESTSQTSTPRVTFDGGDGAGSSTSALASLPSYDEASSSQLAVPVSRVSDSSRSDGSSGDHTIYGQTTTVTHTTHTTTTFFKLPRRKKDRGSLFPLPPRSQTSTPGNGNTPNMSSSSGFVDRHSFSMTPEGATPTGSPRRSEQHSPTRSAPAVTMATAAAAATAMATDDLGRSDSKLSVNSSHSLRASQRRDRSSTAGSTRRLRRELDGPTPPLPASSRTSTSTAGRPSLAGIFNLTRMRQASEPGLRTSPNTAPATPMSVESNPLAAPPKSPSIVIPERQEGDTPAKYLARLEEVFSRGALVPILSKTDDEFMKNVLRSYMRRFKFFEEPIDMGVRKLLMQVELPKETQQIDRTLQSFADRYHECNPGVFQTPDEAYFIAFSILILHTDVFNKNNKRKMQKTDYLKNTQSQGVAPEILECFYDNVAYTPFIHLDDDTEFIAEKLITHKRKGGLKSASTTSLRRQGQPVDPYALILDGKLDELRVPVEDVIAMDDPFGYLGTAKVLNHTEMRKAFFRTGVIQIVSSRSRPDAFSKEATIHNPSEAQVGVVDMKVTKVGVLWRKDPKKRKTRSPWQEWGAILTGSQLYFFRNKEWVKSLMHQHENHARSGRGKTAVVFKPPIDNFKPDFLISTEKMVALCDSQYRRHKNAFVVSRENIYQEVFLADNEAELNDWLAKINYVAAFRTSGVRMRGVASSSSSEGGLPPSSRDTNSSLEPVAQAATESNANNELAQQIAQARRQILARKLDDMAEKMVAIDKLLAAELRTARHLAVLTPIQERSRNDVLTAAARLAAKLRWERMNRWRVRCHRDILHVDLDEDLRSMNGTENADDDVDGPSASGQGREGRTRLPFPRFNSKPGSTPGKHAAKDHKISSMSPNTTTKFLNNVEEMFKTPSRSSSKPQRKGSWELPPLTFDRRGSAATGATGATSATGATGTTASEATGRATAAAGAAAAMTEEPTVTEEAEESVDPNEDSASESDDEDAEAEDDVPAPAPVGGCSSEEKPLQPQAPSLKLQAAESVKSDDHEDAVSTTESEVSSTPRPKRHSLQKRLHSNHSVTYNRNRKARESSSTVNTSEDGNSLAPPEERLARSPGSFTLHGKKASVITFGSEWQALTGEEGLRARKQTITGDGDIPPADLARKIENEKAAAAAAQQAREREIQSPLGEEQEFVDAREVQSPQVQGRAASPSNTVLHEGVKQEQGTEVEA